VSLSLPPPGLAQKQWSASPVASKERRILASAKRILDFTVPTGRFNRLAASVCDLPA
jgi:hypothetical protein